MAATDEMLEIALRHRPHAACIVPENRKELTTEGGLNAAVGQNYLTPIIRELLKSGIRVSLFIEADRKQLDAAANLGAPVVELHTGAYSEAKGAERKRHYQRIVDAASHAEVLGIECHAGHGLSFDTVGPVAVIPSIVELNIGHFLIGEAIFVGLSKAIKLFKKILKK